MRLVDVENIDYVRLEDSLHCLEHHKGDEVECVICAPLVEAIPKADYENRLRADLKAMLTDFLMDIEENTSINAANSDERNGKRLMRIEIIGMFEQKINSLKEQT